MADSNGTRRRIPFEIGVQEGETRNRHTAEGTGAIQQKLQRPVQTYIADGDMFEVDKNKNRLFPDTGNASIPRGPMAGTWQSRNESFSQADVDRLLDPTSPTYNPANYERMMAQARCDAYAEVQAGSRAWDAMTRDERNALRISNPQRAEALEQDFFARLDEKYGPGDGEAMAMEYGYTEEDLYGDGIEEEWDSRTDADFDRDHDWVGDDDMDSVPNRAFTPTDAMQELEDSRTDIDANPYLDADAEKAALKALDQEELQTGFVRPQGMYPGNDGFIADRKPSSLKSGDVVSRFEERGRSGSTGTFTARAEMGTNGELSAPSFQDRSMVEMEETMQQHFFQVAEDYEEVDPVPPEMTDLDVSSPVEDKYDSGVCDFDSPPPPDRQADSSISAEEADGMGASVEAFGATTQSETQSTTSESSASLGDRYQSAYADRIKQTPSLESNRWAGERGESVCAPQSDAARQIMDERGIDGVQYQDGIPDFSPFSESTVKLGYMTDARHSQGVSEGRDGRNTIYAHFEDGELVSESHHADKSSVGDLHLKYDKPGNFEQADALTAEQWTADGRDGKEWTAEDVAQYRQDNGLTWHECNDMETMQMIPEAINADFGHLGGVGEVKETQRIVDEALADYDDGQMVEDEDYERMTPEELDAATREHGHYTDDGVWVPEQSEDLDVDEGTAREADAAFDEALQKRLADQGEELGVDENAAREADAAFEEALQERLSDQGEELGVDENAAREADAAFDEALQERLADQGEELGVDENAAREADAAFDEALQEHLSDQSEELGVDEDAAREADAAFDEALQERLADQSEELGVDEAAAREADAAFDEALQDRLDDQSEELGVDEVAAREADAAFDEALQDRLADQAEEQTTQETAAQEAKEQTTQEAEEQAAQEAAEQETEEQAAQEAAEQEAEEQAAQEAAEQEAEEQAAQEAAEQEIEEQATQEAAEQEVEEQASEEAAEQEAEEQAAQEAAEQEAEEQAAQEAAEQEAEEQAAQEAAEQEAEEQAAQEAAEQEAEEQASEEAAEQEAEEQAAQEIAEQEAEEQASEEAAEQEAEEQAAQEVAEQEVEEQVSEEAAEQEVDGQAAQEAAEQEAEEQAAQEVAEQEVEEQATQEAAEQKAEEQTAQEAAEQEVEEQASEEAAEQEAEEQAAQEAAEQEAEEQAAQEAAEQEAVEQAAQEAAEQEAEEQAAQEAAEQEAVEQAAQEAAEQEAEEQTSEESYDDLVDDQDEECFDDIEDYSDLADDYVEESIDDSGYEDLIDEPAEDSIGDNDNFSDMADDIDTGSYEDSSFDSPDVSYDVGDTGSFDDGGSFE